MSDMKNAINNIISRWWLSLSNHLICDHRRAHKSPMSNGSRLGFQSHRNKFAWIYLPTHWINWKKHRAWERHGGKIIGMTLLCCVARGHTFAAPRMSHGGEISNSHLLTCTLSRDFAISHSSVTPGGDFCVRRRRREVCRCISSIIAYKISYLWGTWRSWSRIVIKWSNLIFYTCWFDGKSSANWNALNP